MRRFLPVLLAGWLVLGSGTAGCGRVLQGAFEALPAFLINDEQEVAIGRQAAIDVVRQIPVLDNAAIQNYVKALGAELVAHSERTNIPYTFTVLQSDEPNAFALPGGFIFMTTGMLRLMENEAQLSGVLAHEIGHVAEKHSVELIRQAAVARGIQVEALGTEAGLSAVAAQVLTQLVLSGYSREKELESDRLGALYTAREGYTPTALGDVLLRLSQTQGQRPSILAPFASHPAIEQRVQALRAYIEQNSLQGAQLNAERFQQMMAPIR